MTLPRLRLRGLALGAILLTSITAGAARAARPGPASSAAVAVTSVTDCPSDGVRVPSDYLGLSIEWSMVQHWFGTSRNHVVEPTVALLSSLESSPATAGVLRIGGNSQDGYQWDPTGDVKGNKLFDGTITRGMVDALLEVSRRTGWKIVLGLNLRSNRPDLAAAMTHYVVAHDPTSQLLAVETGNEPTVYFGDDGDSYVARVNSYVDALQSDPVTRRVEIAGPSIANRVDLGLLTRMRQSFGSRLPFVTWHHYANRPTLTGLLSDAVSTEWTDRLDAVKKAADGTPTRMDEGNSVGTGGLDKVSNVMGSTAWLMDSVLTGAQAGLQGYNLHAWDGYYYPAEKRTSYYTPFVVRGGLTFPRPEFYAMALLKDAVGKSFCRTATAAAPDSVKSWGLIDPATQHVLVYVVNKAPDSGGPVVVAAPSGYAGGAVVSRIADPQGCAGRTSAVDGSRLPTHGQFSWTPAAAAAVPGTSSYTVDLAPCQTALLDITPG
ncbi:MAG: glycosyl hydrolase family 79 C-terminal domain-containing protein [Mycobacteriales bacterium]